MTSSVECGLLIGFFCFIISRATSLSCALQEDWKSRVPNPDEPVLRVRASAADSSVRRSVQISMVRDSVDFRFKDR